jgi:hypothetical protein
VGTHILSSSYANRTLPDHAHRPGTIPPYQWALAKGMQRKR